MELSSLLLFTAADYDQAGAHTFAVKGVRNDGRAADSQFCIKMVSVQTAPAGPIPLSPPADSSSPEYTGVLSGCTDLTWRNLNFPRIATIGPSAVPMIGGVNITIAGSTFTPGIRVLIGSYQVPNVTLVPAGAALPSVLSDLESVWGMDIGSPVQYASPQWQIEAVSSMDRLIFTSEVVSVYNASQGYFPISIINPDGSVASCPSPQCPIRAALYFTDDCPYPGSFGRGVECKPCPSGAECPGGYRIWSRTNFWVRDEFSPRTLSPCQPPFNERCLGLKEGGCGPGYSGEYCSVSGCMAAHRIDVYHSMSSVTVTRACTDSMMCRVVLNMRVCAAM